MQRRTNVSLTHVILSQRVPAGTLPKTLNASVKKDTYISPKPNANVSKREKTFSE